jgi:hypothetical protein
MRPESPFSVTVQDDAWLEAQCRAIVQAGKELTRCVAQVNQRLQDARNGELGRKQLLTETHLRAAQDVLSSLHEIQVSIQNALFDCEHEIRSLRERDVSPAELLVDGERLISQYRFLRRRARVIDGLLAYLPGVHQHTATCIEWLRQLREGARAEDEIAVPDCGFALVALDQLKEGDR